MTTRRRYFMTTFSIALAFASLCLSGCAKDAVIFSTSTRLGIELNTTEGGQQGVRIGYKRSEGVTMPQRKEDGTLRDEAYPVFAAFRFDTGSVLLAGLGTTEIDQRFATGDAANAATSSESALSAMLAAKYVSTEASECLARWRSDGAGPARSAALGDWLVENGLEREPAAFIYSNYGSDDQRKMAIAALGVDCEE